MEQFDMFAGSDDFKLNLKSPLAVFDLETTGTHISKDRIVEISIVKIQVSGEREVKTMRINPEVHIPTESSLIHGIYLEDIKDAPTFKQVAKNLATYLKDCDLCGFNILNFDVPVLVEEFLRAGVEFDISKKKLIDAQKIFHLMEKRTLTAAYKFYCKKDLVNAHSAEADTLATYEIIKAQIKKYDGKEVTNLRGKKLGTVSNDMKNLHVITHSNKYDLAGRMVYNEGGQVVFNFGKHRGIPVADILKKEPSYYNWIMKGDFSLETKQKLTQLKLQTSFG